MQFIEPATQDVVIECEGKKVEWWRVLEEELSNWSWCCPLLWPDFTSLVPDFLSLGHGEIKKFEENYSLKRTQKRLRGFT